NTTGNLGASQSVFYNIPKAVSQGVEVELTWTPVKGMRVLMDYSYLDAKIKQSSGTIDPSDPAAIQPTAHPTGPAAGTDVYTGLPVRGQNL
ncbi:hypothetical protein ABTN07_20070, partial [Acinetobacter baumannii]